MDDVEKGMIPAGLKAMLFSLVTVAEYAADEPICSLASAILSSAYDDDLDINSAVE
jgi:hypothetical protein